MEKSRVNLDQWERACQALHKTSITSDLMDLVDIGARNNLNRGYYEAMDAMLDRYSELLSRETDWVQLVEEDIFAKEIFAYGLCVGVDVDFVVRADMNIALGSSLEYEVGKRYSFWFEIGLFKPTAGSSTMDLIDERFAFQFYVMGKLGLKAGVAAKVYVGIGTGELASVGIRGELGPYIKLYGFYVYEYTRYRAKNTQNWISSERMEGALYLDFGLYFMLSFEAEALGLFEYTHDFLNEEVSLLESGALRYLYGFTYSPDWDESVVIRGKTLLPESYLALGYIDLRNGIRGSETKDRNKYFYSFSNPAFSIDDEGILDVKLKDGVRVMTCDLTITYTGAKMPFTDCDMSVTIPLVWTNLTNQELKEYLFPNAYAACRELLKTKEECE